MRPFSGAVLAGGASSRMGTDKALIPLGPVRLVEIAVGALTDAGAGEVFIVGGDRPALESLSLRFVDDLHPGAGPLGGIITALRAAASDPVVVLACDHIATDGVAVRSVLGALGSADVAVPVVDGRDQMLHAAWRSRALAVLEQNFDRGARSVREGLEGLRVSRLLDGDPCWFRDADTPDDLPEGRR